MAVTRNNQQKSVKKQKKSRSVRKNKKKHWKKIDLTDIDEGLQRQRLELRTGGLLKNKKDSDLFVLGTSEQEFSKKQDDRLFVDKVIVPNPDAIKAARPQSKLSLSWQNNRSLLEYKKLKQKVKRLSKSSTIGDLPIKDIWAKSVEEVQQYVYKKPFLKKYAEAVSNKLPRKIPTNILEKSQFNKNAVKVVHPGASYNPSFDDHQQLLQNEHTKEEERDLKAKKISRALAVDPNDYVTPEIQANEEKEGLCDFEKHEMNIEAEKDLVDAEETILNLDKKFKPKSKKQNIHEKKLAKQSRAKEIKKRRSKDLNRIGEILLEIEQEEKKRNEKYSKHVNVIKQPRLSVVKYIEPDPVFKLSSEIEGSLRKLKPEGNIMFDRFKSFQKRCLILPREKVDRKKQRKHKKFKVYEKKDFREISI